MITGRLKVVNGYYYAILNLRHPDGKRLQKRFDLDLPALNNKRRAEEKLTQLCQEYTRRQQIENNSGLMSLDDYAVKWLSQKEASISPSTYRGYKHIVDKHMASFFKEIQLKEITFSMIEEYYCYLYTKGVSSTTAQHHHMLLKQIFGDAYKHELILRDPMPFVQKPKRQAPKVNYYTLNEAQLLLQKIKGHKLEVIVTLCLFYGFRRSEALGLKWSDIDFSQKRITINRTIVEALKDGKRVICEKNDLKAKGSHRTLPLVDFIEELLLDEYNRKCQFQSEYVCTDGSGKLINPDEVTHAFMKFLEKENLRHIRFHDLRHSCASLMIAARIPLIEVQHWLGHSTMLTTADMYSHLEYESKIKGAEELKFF